MSGWRLVPAVAIAVAALAPATAPAQMKEAGDEIAVGKNAVGEDCKLRLVSVSRDRLAVHRYALLCEGWSVPSGEVRRFRALDQFPPERLVTDSIWLRSISGHVTDCRPPEATTLSGGAPAALRQCLREGTAFPVVIAAARLGPQSYALEALPANFRVLERAVEILEGRRAPADLALKEGGLSAAIRRAEAVVGTAGTLASVQDLGAAETLYRLGLRYHRSGDHPGAEDAYRRLLEVIERALGRDDPALAPAMMELAVEVSLLRRFPEAAALFARAEPVMRKSLAADLPGRLLAYRSFDAQYRGAHDEARRLAEQSLAVRQQTFPPESSEIGHSYATLALAHERAGRRGEAMAAAEQALRVFERGQGDWERALYWASNMIGVRGRALWAEGRHAEARAELERGVKREEQAWGDAPIVAERYYWLGRLGVAEKSLDRALADYRHAARIWETNPAARGRVSVERVVHYVEALLAAAAQRPADRAALLDEALAAAQLPAGSETARALRQMAVRIAAADPAVGAVTRALQDAARRRDRLRVALAEELARPTDQRRAAREEGYRRDLRATLEQIEAQERRLQAEFPRYAQLTRGLLLHAADLKAILRADEALLVALVASEGTVVLLVRDGEVQGHRVALGARALGEMVRALRAGVDLTGGSPRPFDVSLAHRLYQELVAPVAGSLAGVRHLVVAPSGPLLSLPPGVLVTRPAAPPASGDYRGIAWLGHEVALSVVPSVASIRELRQAGPSKAPRPFVGFGDPLLGAAEGDDGRAVTALGDACRQGAADSTLLRGLPRLPETARELQQIARALGADAGSVVTGADATEARVKAADLGQHRVVAFATHGILPGELRCQTEPGLALTPPPAPGATEDGLLDASEVAQLRLDADWVLLSACNTAGPDGRFGGESLSGLARAFFYAGARALLVSHWAVASRPTATLTTGTLGAHARDPGIGRAEALRRAQVTMAAQPATSHPAFWAPFVLVGDGGAAP